MPDNRPRSREKHVTGNSRGVSRRGSGLGTGPVGGRPGGGFGGSGGGRNSGGFGGGSGSGGGRNSGGRGSGGGRSPLTLIIILVVALLGGGGGATALLTGGYGSGYESGGSTNHGSGSGSYNGNGSGSGSQNGGSGSGSSSQAAGIYSSLASTGSGGWSAGSNIGRMITEVAPGSRDKYTAIRGDGKDTTTIMIYMCGTDLESRSGMATNDLNEMLKATTGSNLNLLIYTGGCTRWKNNTVSADVNQIYQIANGKMKLLEKNMGSKAMTSPATLTEFIRYCRKNYPADRNDLILWDHGGGSVSGYGYDEKMRNAGSMTLAGIDQALKDAGMTFDFIGFDACLMATAETALMLEPYADYLIASEETEPGVGWYYTDWLTAYGRNPSMSTLDIGRNIIDTFVAECARTCRGQQTTLSILDLAEFGHTVPEKLSAFSNSTVEMIRNQQYQAIATARSRTREFARSSRIDQCDLVDLLTRIGTPEAADLSQTLLHAVKYNRTSTDMTNAYGVSIYFPCAKMSTVNSAVKTYQAVGMNDDYTRCIREYAALAAAGQTAASGYGYEGNAMSSLLGSLLGGGSTGSSGAYSGSSGSTGSSGAYGGSTGSGSGSSGAYGGSSGSGSYTADMTAQILSALLVGGDSAFGDLFSGRSLSEQETVDYIDSHHFRGDQLTWREENGQHLLTLEEEQWAMVTDLELNMYYDDGSGFIDLGMDNLFTLTEEGSLVGDTDRTWLAIDGQPVAYYHTATMEDGDAYTITGYVPALVNGERMKLQLVFDSENPYGYVAGMTADYREGETETTAKMDAALQEGDVVEFLCDYYTYDGEYQDTYYLGEPLTWKDGLVISNVDVGEGSVRTTYCFTDIYGMRYWTEALCE